MARNVKMADQDMKCMKEELATLKAQMSILLRSQTLTQESITPSNGTNFSASAFTTTEEASSGNNKKRTTSAWDVDDDGSSLEKEDDFKVSTKGRHGTQGEEEVGRKTMSGQMEEGETFCEIS